MDLPQNSGSGLLATNRAFHAPVPLSLIYGNRRRLEVLGLHGFFQPLISSKAVD